MIDPIPAGGKVAVVMSTSERPRVHAISDTLGSELALGEDLFRDAGVGDWLGFYDWLRTRSGEVIGVRLWVDEANEQLRAAGSCAGVVAGRDCFPLAIYFGESREFEDELSCDQDFGSNMLLVSANAFAMTFNAPEPRAAGND